MSKNNTITLTFGDRAENHKGMEIMGDLVEEGEGFNHEDLLKIYDKFKRATLYRMECEDEYEAWVLVLKNGVKELLKGTDWTVEDFYNEQMSLNVDKQAFMYGRVVEKKARWNLCFDEEGHEPDYAAKKGRVICFGDVPITRHVMSQFTKYFGKKAENLKGEGNYYYDIKKCGIGFHGDSERRKVIAIRLGASLPIHYQWFYQGEPIGERVIIPLDGGDIYVMSEKAVGTDWKRKVIPTLRHATGCAAFTTIKKKSKGKKKADEEDSEDSD